MSLVDVEEYIEQNPSRWIPAPEIAQAMEATPSNTYKQLARLRKRKDVHYCRKIIPTSRSTMPIYHYKYKED